MSGKTKQTRNTKAKIKIERDMLISAVHYTTTETKEVVQGVVHAFLLIAMHTRTDTRTIRIPIETKMVSDLGNKRPKRHRHVCTVPDIGKAADVAGGRLVEWIGTGGIGVIDKCSIYIYIYMVQ